MTWWTKLCLLSSINGSYKGVAKTLTNYAHQMEAIELNSDIFNCVPFQNVTSIKGKNLLPEDPFCMGKHYTNIKHLGTARSGRYANFIQIEDVLGYSRG